MGARGSRQDVVVAEAAPASKTVEEPLAPVVSEAEAAQLATGTVEYFTIATLPLAPVIFESLDAAARSLEARDAEYQEVLARCAELRRTRQELLQVKLQVRATIGQFTTAFGAEGSETSENCLCDPGIDAEQDDDEEVEPASYEEALAEEEELEDEVETLREMLEAASAMVANITQESQQWSERLDDVVDDVENEVELPAEMPPRALPDTRMTLLSMKLLEMPTKAIPIATPNASLDYAPVLAYSKKVKQDRMKLPALKLDPLPGVHDQPGSSGSEASSSTATPRSEHDAWWCEDGIRTD